MALTGRSLSIGRRIVGTMLLFSVAFLVLIFALYAMDKKRAAIGAFVEKAREITLVVEGSREEMEAKWALGVFSAEGMRSFAEAGETQKLLAVIPVVTAWQTAMRKAEEGGFTFKVPKFSPRNPKNQPDALEAEALKLLAERGLNEHYQIDPQRNAVRYYRAVRLTAACLPCHGDPAKSVAYWGNDQGRDPTGGKMENWREGEVHGAFEVILSLDAADRQVANALWAGAGVSLLVLILGGIWAFLTGRFLSRPIRATARAIQQAARGDFTSDLEAAHLDRGDEIGQMMRDLDHMNQSLSTTIRQVTAAALTVASTSSQISQGNQDLSERTQQQASAIEQTASAIEEMTSSVKHNADNASQANSLARKTAGRAQEGGEALNRTVAAMAAVTASSRKIADIINVVNEIAFQTNLLALNAAVEAARAGEAGRGFAVVAGEVRNLAGRSATAAKEIQALITDSVTKVEQGNQLVAENGRLLSEIIENVRAVADTIAEISAASQEQAAGIEEVNKAVAQMDESVQQNAALVEEAASTSETSAQAARELRALMERFTVRPGRPAGEPEDRE